jgi:hypothetical protein
MWTTPRSEPVGEADKVHLVDGVEYLDDGPLENLVLQTGDAERPEPPVCLRDVRPARRPCPVSATVDPLEQSLKVSLQVHSVGRPRHPIDTGCGLWVDRPVSRPETVEVDVVQQRREPCILFPSCYLTHTVQPSWHVMSGTASGTCWVVRVPLGQAPFLHHLRHRHAGIVRQLRR